jgi:hypothetical protein
MSYDSPLNFNSQLGQWLPIANSQRIKVLDGRQVNILDNDRAAKPGLPPVAPMVETVTSVRHPDCSGATPRLSDTPLPAGKVSVKSPIGQTLAISIEIWPDRPRSYRRRGGRV